ncbi:hypothetical protein NQZ68_014462 [Dissostichus eleginoides]|nr:hypothetical protein NQZ68_014462 [Dissostichus eleginoides]
MDYLSLEPDGRGTKDILVEDEMSHMEDEVEYYSLYDTLMEETAVTLMENEQSSLITQENSGFGGEPHTEGTAGRDFHMEDQ